MAILALMAMAGAVAIPSGAGSGQRWLRPGDVPKSAFETGEEGAFLFKAVVNPAGKVELCTIEASPARPAEREAFCERVKQRFAYQPVAGAQIYYVLEENYAFILPSDWKSDAQAVPPHFVVDVQKLPGAAKGIDVNVNVAVDERGALRECSVPQDVAQQALASLACGQLPAMWAPMPEKNAAGQAVAYVRQLKVAFREKSAG